MSHPEYGEKELETLRSSLSFLSDKRRNHVLEVEKMAARMGAVYLPGRENELILRAAALLHDITKEYKVPEQVQVLKDHGEEATPFEFAAPKTFHARTAALLIPDRYPAFALPEVISAVRWHTTGKADMNLYEKIIYLADYIDESRKFEECIRLREEFWAPDFTSMTEEQKLDHLNEVMIDSFNVTLRDLMGENLPVCSLTNDARNYLILEKKRKEA